MRAPLQGCLVVALMAAASVSLPDATAQTRCEPTIANPCKPPANAATTPGSDAQKPRGSTTRLDPQPLLPDIKVDKDTSMGFGHGGVVGFEKKF